METYLRLARAGGTIVLEDPDVASWHFNPPAPALEKLIALIVETFRLSGGDWNAGRNHLHLLREFGIEGDLRAEVFALPPGHPYLRLPLQFATAFEERLRSLITADELATLREHGEAELRMPGRWGTTFTLVQAGAVAQRNGGGMDLDELVFHPWSAQGPRRPSSAARQPRSRRRRPALPGLQFATGLHEPVASTRASLRPSRNRPTALCALAPAHASDVRGEAARLIVEVGPNGLGHVLFTTGGTETIEHAVWMARP